MYNDIKLDKNMYNIEGKSFTTALEELDPSSAYAKTPLEYLDAFERQLKRYNIRVTGQDCSCVSRFFASEDTAILFPEYVKRCITKGFDRSILSSITAVKTIHRDNQYACCTLDNTNPNEDDKTIALEKYGRTIKTPYETVKNQYLNVFGVMLESIGVMLGASVTKRALETLAKDAAGSSSTPSIGFNSLMKFCGQFDTFDMTHIIANPVNVMMIAKMYQLANINIAANGKMTLPFGPGLIKTAAIPENTLIGIDKNFALEFISDPEMSMDIDKLIAHQLDGTEISIKCGFRTITPDAVKKMTVC